VRAAFDLVRVHLSEIGAWLAATSQTKRPVATGTLNNYRNGRREMPLEMRRLLAKQLRTHARRLQEAAKDLDRTPES
jgi:hypothetical protein